MNEGFLTVPNGGDVACDPFGAKPHPKVSQYHQLAQGDLNFWAPRAGLEPTTNGLTVILTNEEEYRRHTPDRSWRRKGWTLEERRLIDVVDTLLISDADDLAALLPTELPEPFTTADLALKLGRSRRAAQQMAYCLRIADVIIAVGKRGNAVEYRVRGPRP